MSTENTETTRARPRFIVEIGLVSFAALLLEISYTRIFSYKIFFYYTYLVLGLALLGIGAGGVLVAVSKRLRDASTQAVVSRLSLAGAIVAALGYFVIAFVPVNTTEIWEYGTGSSFANLAVLLLICVTLFSAFVSVGIIVATLLGRAGDEVGKLYFADLLGAGIACALAVYLQWWIGPPASVFLAAAVLGATALLAWEPRASTRWAPGILSAGLLAAVVFNGVIPDPVPETSKEAFFNADSKRFAAEWGPVFRVEVVENLFPETQPPGVENRWLVHDGLVGSALYEFDGDVESLTHYDDDSRSLPFKTLATPPERMVIIGSAGGNEILASLHYGAGQIDAVELNPVTVDFLENRFRDYTGDLAGFDNVDIITGDGRTYIARSDEEFDLIWFVAPDSYAALNAASSSAFVLSESYLYTKEMVEEALGHLTDDGMMVTQFGEYDDQQPNRTLRYIVTVRAALEARGVDDPDSHIVVATNPGFLNESTVMVKRTPFTAEEVERFRAQIATLDGAQVAAEPGSPPGVSPIGDVVALDGAEYQALVEDYPFDISAVTDDSPFFWHFRSFGNVLANITDSVDPTDRENGVGERVLLLLLVISTLLALVFLLLPFWRIRDVWRQLPRKGVSAVYFSAIGLGFMFFEITLIQRLTLFLGYPTYSLTVTLASILIFTGLGALASQRIAHARRATLVVFALLVAFTVFYQFGLAPLVDALLPQPLAVRIAVTFLVLAPLGLCLGMFMPLGLRAIAHRADHEGRVYVAWGWAVNGFASVVGATLTTILSMTFGFTVVLWLALAVYAVAVLMSQRLYLAEAAPA